MLRRCIEVSNVRIICQNMWMTSHCTIRRVVVLYPASDSRSRLALWLAYVLMALVLIIAGAVWFSFALIFILALMCAARRGVPPEVQPHTARALAAESVLQREVAAGNGREMSAVIAEINEPISVPSGIALASIQSPIGMPE